MVLLCAVIQIPLRHGNYSTLVTLQIVAFGSVSAMFNPAAAISQVVAGNLGPSQFFTVIAGEMVGAFLGGLTVYLLYIPQLYKAGAKVFDFQDLKEGIRENKAHIGQRGSTVSVQPYIMHCFILHSHCQGI